METDSLDGNNVWRDGFVSSFTMILLAEIADKTFFIAAILGGVLIAKYTNVPHGEALTQDPCQIRPLASRFRTDRLLSTQRAMRYNKIIVFVGAYGALVIMTLLSCALGFVVNLIPSYITHYLGRFSIRCHLPIRSPIEPQEPIRRRR